jgi:MFS transporter, DHA2 family, multidrug resistance protein
MACVIIFMVSSFACGAATSLGMLIAARVVQGAGGGALQPISQAILLESFPPEKRGAAMAAFALGVVVAPIIGPTLGGWLTDNYSWRWAYYINLPVGALAIVLMKAFIEDPPYIRQNRSRKIDIIGFGLMAVGLAALQIMLDKGQQEDWFASDWIRLLAATCGISLAAFIIRELYVAEPIVHLKVFCNRNFLVGTSLVTLLGVVLYSAVTLQPLFLQIMMDYPALQAGWAVSPRGAGALIVMPIIGYLASRTDNRLLISAGFALLGTAMYLFGSLNLQASVWDFVWPSFWTGVGIGSVFVPLATVTMGTLPRREIGNASGLFNLLRNIGGSVGISIFTTLLARGAQANQARLVSKLTPANPIYQLRLQELLRYLQTHFGAIEGLPKALGTIYGGLLKQSMLLAFVNDFRSLAVICALCIPLVFVFKNVKIQGPAAIH